MTTAAKTALDWINGIIDRFHDVYEPTAPSDAMKEAQYVETIRAALKLMDEVQRYPVSSGSTWNDAVAHTINHLKQIAGV